MHPSVDFEDVTNCQVFRRAVAKDVPNQGTGGCAGVESNIIAAGAIGNIGKPFPGRDGRPFSPSTEREGTTADRDPAVDRHVLPIAWCRANSVQHQCFGGPAFIRVSPWTKRCTLVDSGCQLPVVRARGYHSGAAAIPEAIERKRPRLQGGGSERAVVAGTVVVVTV